MTDQTWTPSTPNGPVVVTGAARGMGAAICRRFAAAGVAVIVADVLDDPGTSLATELGPQARFCHLDVTVESDWRQLRASAERDFGAIGVLINNAGIIEHNSIQSQEPRSFRRILDVDLFGPWLGIHVLAPSLRAAGRGVIINVSSTAGMRGTPNLSAYVAAKWGVRGLTRTAALELAEAGVRVCSIHPGPTRTAMTARYDDSRVADQPIARLGEPDEVAAMAWFIATEATFSTGAEFVVDGGELLGPLPATAQR